MTDRKYQVWTEDVGHCEELGYLEYEEVLFEGSKTEAYKYYKEHGGSKAGLHIGYELTE